MDVIPALTRVYHAIQLIHGQGAASPLIIQVGEGIWAYYQQVLKANIRWTDEPVTLPEPRYLAFKAARVYFNPALAYDEYRFFAPVYTGRCSEPQANGTGLG